MKEDDFEKLKTIQIDLIKNDKHKIILRSLLETKNCAQTSRKCQLPGSTVNDIFRRYIDNEEYLGHETRDRKGLIKSKEGSKLINGVKNNRLLVLKK